MKGINKLTDKVLIEMSKVFEEDELLKENPDRIRAKVEDTGEWVNISVRQSDARAFGWYKKKLYVGDDWQDYHYDLLSIDPDDKNYKQSKSYERDDFSYPGRIWLDHKMISFWKFPPPNKFNKLMKELGSHSSIKKNLLSKGWLVEVILNKKNKIYWKFHNDEWEQEAVLIPTTKYFGSEARSSEELQNPHLMTYKEKQEFLKKWKSDVYNNRSKHLPKGMTQVQYNWLKSQYKFQEGLIKENPDRCKVGEVKYTDEDARAFGFWKGEPIVAEDEDQFHNALRSPNRKWLSRDKLAYSGRLWLKSKIMSFWKYPSPKKWVKLLKLLGEHPNVKKDLLSNGWRAEIVPDKNGTPKQIRDARWKMDGILIPTTKYTGSDARTKEELQAIHLMTYEKKQQVLKQYKKDVYGGISSHLPKGMTIAQAKYLMSKYKFAESIDMGPKDIEVNDEEIYNIVNENPDSVRFRDGYINFASLEAVPFGVNGLTPGEGKVWIGKSGGMHKQLYDIAGRAFREHKILSFWKWPPTTDYLWWLLGEVGKKLKINFRKDKKWQIEIYGNNIESTLGKRYPGKDGKFIPLDKIVAPGIDTIKHKKLPKGMSDAEYNWTKSKYKYQEAIELDENDIDNIIKENPDKAFVKNDRGYEEALDYSDKDAVPFGWYKNKLYVGEHGRMHKQMKDAEKVAKHPLNRFSFLYCGRLWIHHKVISFWDYPPVSKWKKVIKELSNHDRIKTNLWDKKWKVEVIFDDKGKLNLPKNKMWANGWTSLIPVPEYGIDKNAYYKSKWSPEIMAKIHLDPELKKLVLGNPVKDSKKLPRGMSRAEYDWLRSKYKFQEELIVKREMIKEDPDELRIWHKGKMIGLTYFEYGAYPFGWSVGLKDCWVGPEKGNHKYSYNSWNKKGWEGINEIGQSRDSYHYPGRMWTKEKLISFWKYPKPSILIKLIKDLEKTREIKIWNNGWKIEIPDPEKHTKTSFLPLEYYGKEKEYYKKKWSPEVMAKIHLDPELKKLVLGNPIPKDKLPKGMSRAEYNWLRSKYSFTEDKSMNENKTDNYLLKESMDDYVKLFVETLGDAKRLILEETQTHGGEVDDGPASWYRNFRHYSKDVKDIAELHGMKIIDYLVDGVPKDYSNTDDYGKPLPVSYFPAGVAGKSTAANPTDWKGTKAYNAWLRRIKKIALLTGFEFLQFVNDMKLEKQRAIDTTKDITGEEEGIQKVEGDKELSKVDESIAGSVVDELLLKERIKI